MRLLQRDELEQVKPRFRGMVQEAWERGEDVPYGVTWLDDRPLTPAELRYGVQLARRLGLVEAGSSVTCQLCGATLPEADLEKHCEDCPGAPQQD